MALSEDEKKRLLVMMTLLSQGKSGKNALATMQPILAIIEKDRAEKKARDDARRAQINGLLGQTLGTAGTLGGTALMLNGLGAGAAGTAGTAGSVATPTLVGANMVGGGAEATGAGLTTAGTVGETAAGSTLGAIGSAALPVAVAAAIANNAWEGGLKDIVRGKADRADWTNQAVNMNPYTAPINMGLRLFGKRSVGQMMTTNKSDAQQLRDDFRGQLKNLGIADDSYNVTLADGSKFNVGLDGHTKYLNSDGKVTRNAWDIDASNPLTQYAVQTIDPWVRKMYGPDAEKHGIHPEQYTGMLVNAVTSNAKTPEEVKANMDALFKNNSLNQPQGSPQVNSFGSMPPLTPIPKAPMSVNQPSDKPSIFQQSQPSTALIGSLQQNTSAITNAAQPPPAAAEGSRKLDMGGLLALIKNGGQQSAPAPDAVKADSATPNSSGLFALLRQIKSNPAAVAASRG